jgi:hypothetical protein
MIKNFITSSSIILILLMTSCAKDKENSGIAKKNVPINASERAKQTVEKGGGLQDAIFGKKGGSTTFDFATSNSLWRASIQLLQDIPLANVDYSGGVIVTDWYTKNGKESIKINISFSSNELAASSVNVSSFKKLCSNMNDCTVNKMEDIFSSKLKEKIMAKARELELARLKKLEKK